MVLQGYPWGVIPTAESTSLISLAHDLACLSPSLAVYPPCIALSDVENRDLFTETKKEGTVEQQSTSSAMFGFTGTGKSHVQAAILGELPPSKRISTAVATVPVRAIGYIRMSTDLTRKEVGENRLNFNRVSDSQFSGMFLKTAKDGMTGCRPTLNPIKKLQKRIHRLVHTPPEPKDKVEKDLIVEFYQPGSVKSLDNQIVIEMSDCGGQPQFLEVLPR